MIPTPLPTQRLPFLRVQDQGPRMEKHAVHENFPLGYVAQSRYIDPGQTLIGPIQVPRHPINRQSLTVVNLLA